MELVQIAADQLVTLCEATGLTWGPNPRHLFFYRTPSLHVIEFVVFHLFVFVLYLLSRGYYAKHVTHAVAVPVRRRRVIEVVVGLIFVACWLSQVYLKSIRPHPIVQLCWLFMPCHLITLVWAYIFLSKPSATNAALHRYLGTFVLAVSWGPMSAAAVPDWSDHQFYVERVIFIVHHFLLVTCPFYFAARYRLLPFTWGFLVHVTMVTTWINIGPYTVISYLSGLNVNYHLYPPPKLMNHPVFRTQYYRFIVIGLLIVTTVVLRVGIAAIGSGVGRMLRWKKL